ncbi:MAG: aldehyde dehydrogenase family protein [Rhodocyclaceae bacterium]|nr:aldehyde dehydrogenase family protein [Rhodocyclaceae bacterium]
MSHLLLDKHRDTLRKALAAAQSRRYWNPYIDAGSVDAAGADQAREALQSYRGAQFYLDQPGVIQRCGEERSPYGLALLVSYPQCSPDALISAGKTAGVPWARAEVDTRVGVCLEILDRLHKGGAELAQSVMHTTGQPLSLARSHGVAQALARGLEAVAVAWREMTSVSAGALWERTIGAQGSARMHKRFIVTPRGIALLLTCSTAPTWMAFPALFASLATGNPVIVKPHPSVILPLALTVAVVRQTLKEFGFDPNLVSLLVDEADAPVAREIATRPEITLIDCSGRSEFCVWLKHHARQARLFAFSSAINCVVVDSTTDYKGMLRFLVASIAWYSGQLPTSPQNIFVPASGVETPEGRVSAAQFGRDLGFALGKLLDDPVRASEVLGAVQANATLDYMASVREGGESIRDSSSIEHPQWPGARVHTPLVMACKLSDEGMFSQRAPGAVCFVMETPTTSVAIATAERIMHTHGGLELQLYSTNSHVLQLAEEAAMRAGVRLTSNLSGTMAQVMTLNLPSAFSDFQGGGGNPASTATLVDGQFVAQRFSFIEVRSAP